MADDEPVSTGGEPITRPPVNEPRRFLAGVKQRYLTDPIFHARVEMAVQIIRQGYVLEDEGLMAGIAAVGLAMADQEVTGG